MFRIDILGIIGINWRKPGVINIGLSVLQEEEEVGGPWRILVGSGGCGGILRDRAVSLCNIFLRMFLICPRSISLRLIFTGR
jgi:hypothetical protein